MVQYEAKGEVFTPAFRECRDITVCTNYYYFVFGWAHTSVRIFKNSVGGAWGDAVKVVNWSSKQKLLTSTFKSYIIR